MSPMPPTRLEATLSAQVAGLQLHFAWAGLEISNKHQGVVVVPRADGRLSVRVIGYPALTGLAETVSLLDADARHEFPPASVRLDGDLFVCLAPHPRASGLRQGFTLALAPTMALFLEGWLPRLSRVATLAHALAAHVSTLLEFATPAHGSDVCADVEERNNCEFERINASLNEITANGIRGRGHLKRRFGGRTSTTRRP